LPSTRDSIESLITLTRQMTQTQPSTAEVSYPFLDETLVEFLISIPANQLLRPGERRSLMRRALKDVLPQELVSRRTKTMVGRSPMLSLQENWDKLSGFIVSAYSSRYI